MADLSWLWNAAGAPPIFAGQPGQPQRGLQAPIFAPRPDAQYQGEGGAPTSPNDPYNRPGFLQGLAQHAMTPGAAMQPNPYPPGSEEAIWYDQHRQSTMDQWGPAQAASMIGGGSPFAQAGALGAAGGRTMMPGGSASLRGPGGKFIKPMTDARGMPNAFIPEEAGYRASRPGEVVPTAEPTNPMYTAQNAPDMSVVDQLLQRRQTDQLNVNPFDIEYWRSRIPNGFMRTGQ